MSTKKARSDASIKGKGLSKAQKAQLNEWLLVENLSYKEARERLADKFGVHVKSDATLHDYYHSVALPSSYAQAAGVAEAFEQAASGNFDPATVARVKQLLFETATNRTPDLKALHTLAMIVGNANKHALDLEKLELDKRKVTVIEKKAAQADAASGVLQDKSLSEDQRAARMKEIFLIS